MELLGWALLWHRGQGAPGCGQVRAWELWRKENRGGKRSGKERGVVSSVCGKLEQGELVCRPEGRVWRGADPQAHPRSAIDCSAFPINYSLIMENRQHWLHGSGSSSHVAVGGRGTGQPCLYLPGPWQWLPPGDSDSLCWPCSGSGSSAETRAMGWEQGGGGSPGKCVRVQGTAPVPA